MKRIFVAAFALLAMATTASAQNYEVVNDSVAAETTESGTSILAQLMDNAMTEVPAAYPGEGVEEPVARMRRSSHQSREKAQDLHASAT